MSPFDWAVLIAALSFFVGYGLWKSRGERGLDDFLIAGRRMPWPMVMLSVMATQASAITFLSTPGQGFADGLRFVQFYFGLPLAMIVLCVTPTARAPPVVVYTITTTPMKMQVHESGQCSTLARMMLGA